MHSLPIEVGILLGDRSQETLGVGEGGQKSFYKPCHAKVFSYPWVNLVSSFRIVSLSLG